MGACTFRTTRRGKTMSDAYRDACDDAQEEYGHQEGYNGTISTTHGFRDLTSEFKRSGKSLDEFISQKLDSMSKRDCAAITLEEPKANSNKVKSKVNHIVTKGTKKWVLYYVVETRRGEEIGAKKTKGDAVKIGRSHTEKTQERTYIKMEKRLEGVNSRVAEIEYKQSTTEKEGKFCFFGWASE
jgi:hypothetical protein